MKPILSNDTFSWYSLRVCANTMVKNTPIILPLFSVVLAVAALYCNIVYMNLPVLTDIQLASLFMIDEILDSLIFTIITNTRSP